MAYRVFIYCHDCTGQDPLGCFDGGHEEIFADPSDAEGYSSDDQGMPILTREQAEVIGYAATWNVGPWDFTVEEID